MKDIPEITVVISTYNRPHVLKFAIQSVQRQTLKEWELWVIGDCCDERTHLILQEFEADKRIKYINLTRRCGSQALPNSVGMLLSKSKYVALLNHDDLWLPDHLEIALSNLKRNDAQLFLGNVIEIRNLKNINSLEPEPIYTYRERNQTWKELFKFRSYLSLEPSSAWVIRRDLISRTGPWHSPVELYRTSIQDWFLRAWREGAVLTRGDKITCLHVTTHGGNLRKEIIYDSPEIGQALLIRLMNSMTPDQFRLHIDNVSVGKDIYSKKKVLGVLSKIKKYRPGNTMNYFKRYVVMAPLQYLTNLPIWATLYYHTGFDIYGVYARLLFIKKEQKQIKRLRLRVNEDPFEVPSLNEVLLDVKTQLVQLSSD